MIQENQELPDPAPICENKNPAAGLDHFPLAWSDQFKAWILHHEHGVLPIYYLIEAKPVYIYTTTDPNAGLDQDYGA